MLLVQIKCRGTTPLLMNKMSASTLEALRTKTKKPKAAAVGSTTTPREDAAPRVHLYQGQPALPGENLMACLIAAGVFVRLDAKRQISTAKATILPGLMALLDYALPLVDPDTDAPCTWDPDVRRGTNPSGGEAVCIVRPRFDRWSFRCRIEIDDHEIGENTIRSLWDLAGRRVGIGDFRPSRRGVFGQFVIEQWERASTSAT